MAVDNTFLSPYLQRPLALGADLVVHSTTKFLNGHSDSIGGVLVSTRQEHAEWFALRPEVGRRDPLAVRLLPRDARHQDARRAHGAPRDERAARSSTYLAGHPKVQRVLYPGLPDHPGHEVQKRQASGFGSMITFDLGSYDGGQGRCSTALRVFSLAESLGGVESLISHPATMTHASIPPERRAALGITDGLVRLSVGIEDVERPARRSRAGAGVNDRRGGSVALSRRRRRRRRARRPPRRRSSASLSTLLGDPVEEALLAVADVEGEDLGQLVAVELADGGGDRLELLVERLDDEQQLAVGADLAPSSDRSSACRARC